MIRRRELLAALGVGVLSTALPSFAQQPEKLRRIGFLSPRSRPSVENPDPFYSTFGQALTDLGYAEGKNIEIVWRFADEKAGRLPALAAELAGMKVDIIVTHSTPGARAAKGATATIPIVATVGDDPIEAGLAASVGRPGGNVTGQWVISPDLRNKRLELLKLIAPGLSQVGFLYFPDNSTQVSLLKSYHPAAQKLGLKVLPIDARTADDMERGIAAAARGRATGLTVATDLNLLSRRRQIVDLAAKHRLPAIYPYREFVESGGLMSYAQNFAETYRRVAVYVDRILKGASPGELPFEQPTRIYLTINRKTAKELGLAISSEFILRADEVIG